METKSLPLNAEWEKRKSFSRPITEKSIPSIWKFFGEEGGMRKAPLGGGWKIIEAQSPDNAQFFYKVKNSNTGRCLIVRLSREENGYRRVAEYLDLG